MLQVQKAGSGRNYIKSNNYLVIIVIRVDDSQLAAIQKERVTCVHCYYLLTDSSRIALTNIHICLANTQVHFNSLYISSWFQTIIPVTRFIRLEYMNKSYSCLTLLPVPIRTCQYMKCTYVVDHHSESNNNTKIIIQIQISSIKFIPVQCSLFCPARNICS